MPEIPSRVLVIAVLLLACSDQAPAVDDIEGIAGILALNDAGEAVGFAVIGSDRSTGIHWDAGVITLLGGEAYDINGHGQIVGAVDAEGGGRAALWSTPHVHATELAIPSNSGSSLALQINAAGDMVGTALLTDTSQVGLLWRDRVLTILSSLGGRVTEPTDINASGQVVGRSFLAGDLEAHAFLWDNGVMIDLGTLGGGSSEAFDINDAGQVVGHSFTTALDRRAFLWESGVMNQLPLLGGTDSRAFAINEVGAIAGWSDSGQGGSRNVVVWQNGVVTDLGTYPEDEFGVGVHPVLINENGDVVAGFHWGGEAGHSAGAAWFDGTRVILVDGDRELREPTVLNNRRQIIGRGFDGDGSGWFVWNDGVITRLLP